ncbi:MAG: PD-(D/E)XK nuclease family protein [Bacteroidales bacterium]|jgi:hypothetical protein|nr:PD-(D/E)XK nuclease family protein [Bacteroidales bacterium]
MHTDFFLSQVAADLIRHTGGDFSKTLILFPNKRASVFFNQALYAQLQKTFFAPTYSTISEFVSTDSPLHLADELTLLAHLYKAYKEVFYRKNPQEALETFDEFYSWGKTLLHDFDDIDKNLADAAQLFKNIEDYQAFESQFDFLSDEQKKILADFFAACQKWNANSEPIQRFSSLWNSLAEIYVQFKRDLEAQSLAYSGMLYRSVYENQQFSALETYETVAIVGFNVLNRVEQNLFSTIKTLYSTRFYWDYDLYYKNNDSMEAGLFIRENLQKFPQAAGFDFHNKRFSNPKQEICIISAASEHAQVGYVQSWLQTIEKRCTSLSDIAIVLGNETLLPAVLASLPAKIGEHTTKVNITMGYPFKETSLYNLLQTFLDVQLYIHKEKNKKNLRFQKILPLLEHPFFQFLPKAYHETITAFKKNRDYFVKIADFADFAITPFITPVEEAKQLLHRCVQLLQLVAQGNCTQQTNKHNSIETVLSESIYRAYTALNRLIDVCENEVVLPNFTLIKQLIDKDLQNLKIPFEGDPVNGIQIMGVLETRNLDFAHVLVLSTSDDFFPNVSNETSFIPHSFRRAYNLNTIDRKIAVFAYYFYRLFHCAQSIHCCYNSSTGLKKSEMSRFLQQIRIESEKKIQYETVQLNVYAQKINRSESVFSASDRERLIAYRKNLSNTPFFAPSFFNTYLDCTFQWYCKYVKQLKTPDPYNDDMQANEFGNVFHNSAEEIYSTIGKTGTDKAIEKTDIEPYLNNETLLREIVVKQYKKNVLHKEAETIQFEELHELQTIHIEVILTYLKNLLRMDCEYAPFYMLGTEITITKEIQCGTLRILVGGNIDRIDLKNGILRIVDYKTGGKKDSSENNCDFENLFNPKPEEKRKKYVFQTLLYSWLVHQNNTLQLPTHETIQSIIPYLLYINTVQFENGKCTYKSPITIKKEMLTDYINQAHEEFDERFKRLLHELFTEENLAMSRRQFEKNCQYCDFAILCEQ